jgi:hypothetical protein
MKKHDPFKPWNNPMGREKDLTSEERNYYRKKGWRG